ANMVIVGIALIAAALGAIFVPRAWEEWTELVLGLWLIASPAVLGFSAIAVAKFDAAITGIVVTALALWVLITDKDYSGWWRGRTAQ
ncbi:MAG TPA: SPW repeat protein, partial [Burkholderiaceae bacterium]|nr:SPW repeat protein [Burkholderiaceae bacterium]